MGQTKLTEWYCVARATQSRRAPTRRDTWVVESRSERDCMRALWTGMRSCMRTLCPKSSPDTVMLMDTVLSSDC